MNDNVLDLLNPLTTTARKALDRSVDYARGEGRSAPCGEDILFGLIAVGMGEPCLTAVLESLDTELSALVSTLVNNVRSRAFNPVIAESQFQAFRSEISLGHEPGRVDGCLLLALTLTSEFLAPESRSAMERAGLGLERILELHDRPQPAAEPVNPERGDVPFGRLLSTRNVAPAIGRDDLRAVLTERFAAGSSTCLFGSAGVGKGALARAAALASGRTALEIRMPSVERLTESEAAHLSVLLDAYLREHDAGLVLLDDACEAVPGFSLAADLPLIVCSAADSDLAHLGPGPRQLASREVLPLNSREARAAVEAWAASGGRPPLADEAVEAAVALVKRYQPTGAALPGGATELITDAARLSGQRVDRDSLERAVVARTGLPLAVVSSVERERMLSLEARVASKLVGQRSAIGAVSSAIRRGSVALGERSRPLGVFLFVGPTGVGKTELAKIVANEVFGSPADLVRFDMGDYRERHEALKLTGAPPSYIGHDQPGQLIAAYGASADKPQARRGAVLLLDEIEKAHSSVSDLLLAAFDYGFVTGSKGEKVDLRDSIVIMTSNLGVAEAEEATKVASTRAIGFGAAAPHTPDLAKARTEAVKRHFRPEFLNRLDQVVQFDELDASDLDAVLELQLVAFRDELSRYGLSFGLGPRLRAQMVETAVASGFGARDLVLRVFPKTVRERFTDEVLLGGKYAFGADYRLELDDAGQAAIAVQTLPDFDDLDELAA